MFILRVMMLCVEIQTDHTDAFAWSQLMRMLNFRMVWTQRVKQLPPVLACMNERVIAVDRLA